eukprot:CAMPEP_0184353046 /NCGR_PEP_ID=MMETSP1089-20130417/73914_1 /TAXON_ID=38269 ORGANISM="Gloeochaete wittrockiana, Strain SAG46.84" /NCGR_SAMPLE_ID=MMETSP1089 /ASSEMBLY_ACC=CAM_ASM_000445 /LENGTH=613 /DNA_ID=CAMNT_0026688113 /DNA_START=11 /DNA_END=1852 /DNA_ORIENTATION=-
MAFVLAASFVLAPHEKAVLAYHSKVHAKQPNYGRIRAHRSTQISRLFFGSAKGLHFECLMPKTISVPYICAQSILIAPDSSELDAFEPPVDFDGLRWQGTDIRGFAIDKDVTLYGDWSKVRLSDSVVNAIISAFAEWLAAKVGKKSTELRVSVGMDSRLSGPRIKQAVTTSLQNSGVEVFDFGYATTSAMFKSTIMSGQYAYDGSVMVTASHLPFNRNGLKFHTADGGLSSEDIRSILETAEDIYGMHNNGLPAAVGTAKPVQAVDFMTVYAEQLVDFVRKQVHTGNVEQPLQGVKILVDAGNGVGGFFVDQVLKPLGADTTGSQFLEPNGLFPNRSMDPSDESALQYLRRAVIQNKADLGVVFDADVGRCGCVDSEGRLLNRNRLLALMTAIVLKEHPRTTVVTDSVTSQGYSEFVKSLGGTHYRYKRGYHNVITEAKRLNSEGVETWLAMETSGHGCLRENFFSDDAAFLVAKVIVELVRLKQQGQTITSLISDLKEPREAVEFRVPLYGADFNRYSNKVLSELKAYAQQHEADGWLLDDSKEGVRVTFPPGKGDGFFLARRSLHESVLVIYVESGVNRGAGKIAGSLIAALDQYSGNRLDLSQLLAIATP